MVATVSGMDAMLWALLTSWNWRPEVLLVLGLPGGIYVTGWLRLRLRGSSRKVAPPPATASAERPSLTGRFPAPTQSRRNVHGGHLALYLMGLVLLGLALLSPLDTFTPLLFFMHMTQHVLLTMLAPPLLLLAKPFPVILWGLPARLRHSVGGLLTRQALLRRGLWALTLMPVAWLLYVITLWGWHQPAAYQAALRHRLVHDVEHLMFFGTGVLFWWPIINPAPRLQGHIAYGWRMLYVFLAAGQNTLLAALLSLTERVLYPYYLDVPRLWGLPAIDDQAIGGAIMWVVGGMMYPITLLVLVARFLNEEERLTLQHEAKMLRPRGAVGEDMPRADGPHPQPPHEASQEPLAPHSQEQEA